MSPRLALGILLYAASCTGCTSQKAAALGRDTDVCFFQGTFIRDTVIDADLDSLTVMVGNGEHVQNRHAIDGRAPVLSPGMVLAITCHTITGRWGLNDKRSPLDTVVDSFVVVSP